MAVNRMLESLNPRNAYKNCSTIHSQATPVTNLMKIIGGLKIPKQKHLR